MSFWKPDGETPSNADEANAENDDKKNEKTPAELIAESLGPVVKGFEAVNARLDAMEKGLPKKPVEQSVNQPNASVFDDENAAFSQRLTPLVARQLELESRLVKQDIRAEYSAAGYGELWAKFESEIDTVVGESPLVTLDGKPMRGDPQYIRNVVDMIFGRNARKAGMKFGGKSQGFFLESGTSGGDNLNSGPVNDGLSEGQRRVFERMKVSPEDAKKSMARLKFVN